MAILKREPTGRIASAEELLAIAHAIEVEAGRRYRELAGYMRRQGEQKLAALFDSLASMEDKHAHQIDARAQAVIGKAVDPTKVRWELPENFDEEEPRSHLLTPYRTLAIAVRNEERAFAFFAYLAANAEDAPLRRLAEQSAKDELEHAALLRRERRRAWRDEGLARASAGPRAEEPIRSIAELLAQTATIECAAAAEHRALAASLAASGDFANARLFESAAADEQSAGDAAAARLDHVPRVPQSPRPARTTRDGLRILEDVFERYAHLSEHAADELVLAEAQNLAERALRRLTFTKGSIDNALIESATTN